MRGKTFQSLFVVVSVVLIGIVLGGCKRAASEQDPLPVVTSMAMPSPTLVATATPPALQEIVYTSDSNPCPRFLPYYVGGGGGQDPLPIAPNEAVLMKLGGHKGAVTSASFSADGKTIVTSDGGDVRFWDATSGGGDVRLWDATSGELIRVLSHDAGLFAPNFSPDGQMVAAAGGDGTVRLYNTKTGEEVLVLTPSIGSDASPCVYSGDLNSPVFSPDGQIIVTVDGCVAQLWDVATGQEVRRLIGEVLPDTSKILIQNGHAAFISGVAFSPNGQVLVTAGEDWSVRMWDVATSEHLRCFEIQGKDYQGEDYVALFSPVAFSPDGRTVASASDRSVFLWDASTSQLIRSFDADWAATVNFSPDGQTLVTASGSYSGDYLDWYVLRRGWMRLPRRAWLWDVNTGQPIGLMKHPGQVNAAVFSPDGQTILTAIGELTPYLYLGGLDEAWVWDANSEVLAREAFTTERIEVLLEQVRRQREADEADEIEVALAVYTQAQTYDPDIEIDAWAIAVLLIEQGRLLAKAGEIEAALVAYAQAQEYDPDIEIGAWAWDELCWFGSLYGYAAEVLFACEEAVKLAPDDDDIRGIIRHNRGLARAWTGDTTGALDDFRFAVQQWQATFTCGYRPCERSQAWIAALEDERNWFTPEVWSAILIKQRRSLAEAGEIEAALAAYTQAQKYDPDIEAWVIAILIERGRSLAEAGEIEAALVAYAQVQEYDPDIEIGAWDWDELCWFGSLYGYATEVLFACEKAVELAPNDGIVRHNRGLARAWTGDTPGALDDFRFAVQQWEAENACDDQPCERSRAWITALEVGENPFTPEVLEALWNE